MQVFLPYADIYQTAQCLDNKRLNKQIVECQQILDAICEIGKGWFNHPITKMYKEHFYWLLKYMEVLDCYRTGDIDVAQIINEEAESLIPTFITDEYCNQMKRRLYTKNKEHYKQFAEYGESNVNWYFVNGEWIYYVDGKRVNYNR